MEHVAGDFESLGYLIVSSAASQAAIRVLRERFEMRFLPKFTDSPARNRGIVKLFAEDIELKRFFSSAELEQTLKSSLGIREPVQTGPIVTHYTSGNATGNNYGLPYHQDWPSMGTSSKGVIAWTTITDVGKTGPGLSIVPGSHARGLWPGKQTDGGYVLDDQEVAGQLDVEVRAGQILFMSPYLVHKTRTAGVSDAQAWKLSLSCRFDDFACQQWDRRDFVSAYGTSVNREVYLK